MKQKHAKPINPNERPPRPIRSRAVHA
ncbi:MAG: hypothetical protein RL710_1680, partial [Pseudomonadota bacterium]